MLGIASGVVAALIVGITTAGAAAVEEDAGPKGSGAKVCGIIVLAGTTGGVATAGGVGTGAMFAVGVTWVAAAAGEVLA